VDAGSAGTEWRPLFNVRVTEKVLAGSDEGAWYGVGRPDEQKTPWKNWC